MPRLSILSSILLFGAVALRAAPVRAEVFEGTFLQLVEAHRDLDVEGWTRLLDELATLGIEEVVVQWTVFDEQSFLPLDEAPSPGTTLERLLAAADRRGMRVLLGLVHDSSYWRWIDRQREARLVEVSLRRLEERHGEAAERLAHLVRRHDCVAGWYLPEEIDDGSWLPDDRREVLGSHLARVRERLREIAPDLPVAVSGFSNGFADPRTLAGFWSEVVDRSGVDRLLFQDGVGAGKLEPDEVSVVLGPLAASLAGRPARFQVIVEIFRQTGGPPLDDGPFRAVLAPVERIRAQIATARSLSEGGVIAFSAPEYLLSSLGPEAERVSRSLRQED